MASELTRHDQEVEFPAGDEVKSSVSDAAPLGGQRGSFAVTQPALRLGFWAAILATAFTMLFVLLAAAFPSGEWSGIEAYARDFDSLQMAQLLPVLLLVPTVVVLMSSIHTVAPDNRKVYSRIGVALAGVYAAIIATNYMLQLFVVRLNVLNGDLEGLSLIAMANPSSVFVALEAIGYGIFGLVMLFTGSVFTGAKLESWIRGLLVVSGLTGVLGAIAAALGREMLTLVGFGVSLLAFPVATILMAVLFNRLTDAARA